MRILIVEDEIKTADYLQKGLSESGYTVDVVHDGLLARERILEAHYDLFILDVMVPSMDGWQLLAFIRSRWQTPVLFLTARDAVAYRVRGLELGADDYLIKPFSFVELLARVRTLLRRGPPREIYLFRVSNLELDVLQRRVMRHGQVIHLTNREFALLHLLISHENEVLSRTHIASQVWNMNFDSDTNVVDVAIRRLRAKVDEPFDPRLIHTVRGMGYRLGLAP